MRFIRDYWLLTVTGVLTAMASMIGDHDDEHEANNNQNEQQPEQQQSAPLLPRPAPERVHRQPIAQPQPTLRAMAPDHPPRVVRPHRQPPPPTRPISIDEIDTMRLPPDPPLMQRNQTPTPIEEMPTDRLTPEPGSQPAMVRQRKPPPPPFLIEKGDRNDWHTEYQLDRRPWTRVTGYYELVADISRFGDVTVFSVDVGKKWRSVPLVFTHAAVQALLPALLDAQAYYGFFVDDDDGGEEGA